MRLSNEELEDLKQRVAIAKEFSDTFSSDSGKKVLQFLAARFYLNKTSLPEQEEILPIDPLKMAAREGMRTVILFIRDLADFDLSQAWAIIHSQEDDRQEQDKTTTP
jgi:hypothetical protein